MKSYLKIFVAAFLLSAAYCLLSNGFLLIEPLSGESASNFSARFGVISELLSGGAYWISPILVFVVFYFIGKKINLASELKVDTLSLAIGSWVGYEVIYIPLTYLDAVSPPHSLTIYIPVFLFSHLVVGAVIMFNTVLVVGLLGLAIAFIRKAKPDSNLQPTEQQSI